MIFSIKHHNTIISVHSIALKCCRYLYSINKSRGLYRVPLKSSISRKSKLQNLSHELERKLFSIKYFNSFKDSKRNWVSTLLSSEMLMSIGQGLILSPQHNTIISVHSIALKCCRYLYSINKSRGLYRVPLKSSISRKSKLQNLSHELERKLFSIKYFDSFKDSKRNWVSTLLSSEMLMSIGQGLILSGVP